ncbi:MAG TPA: hypothetical protein VGH89_41950 [Pseudonocardia sp.]
MLRVGAENVSAAEPGASADEVVARVGEACRRMLADFTVPRAVYAVRDLPRSTLAKIDKKELRTVAGVDADRDAAQARWTARAANDPSGDAL